MIKKIDSSQSITISDLDSNGVKVTYSPTFSTTRLRMIKISKAVLKLNLNTITSQNSKIYFINEQTQEDYLIDELSGENKKIYIDITDELQSCLTASNNYINLHIENIKSSFITMNDTEVILEYYFKKESINEQSVYQLDAGKAGTGEINLATGRLKFAFQNTISNSKALPISINHLYDSIDAGTSQSIVPFFDGYKELPKSICGKGWKTNFNQFIIKENLDAGTFTDKKTSTRFTYINADGDFIIFESKYFWKDSMGEQHYLPADKVYVDQDGEYKYLDENGIYHEVENEIISNTGLSLITKYENMQGVSLLTQDNEEITNLKEEIKSLNKSIYEMTLQRENNNLTIELLNISNDMSLLNQSVQENNIANEQADIDLQNQTKSLNEEYKSLYKKYSKLVDERAYMFKGYPTDMAAKAVYPTVEEYNTKLQYEQKSEQIDNLNNQTTWGNGNNDIGVIKRREDNLKIQKDIFEMNKQYSSQQFALEIKKLNEQNESLGKTISEYDELVIKKTHQLETLQEQMPEIVITDNNGNVLAFSVTSQPNVFKLFAIMDNYENQIQIIYDNNKIEKIIDSENNSLTFSYDDNLLTSIEDIRHRKTSYKYDTNQNLIEVQYPSGAVCKYSYDDNGNLIGVINDAGMGYAFEYKFDKVVKVREISCTSKISNDIISPVSSNEIKINNSITIQYNNYDSTSITNEKTNKTTTYVFDNLGRVINKYENVFENGSIIGNVDAVSYERNNNKSTFVIKELAYSENVLDNIKSTLSSSSMISENYFGDGVVCGDDVATISLETLSDENSILICNSTQPIITKTLTTELIEKIKSEKITDLVLSGWAKADAAWVARKNTDYCGKCEENSSENELEQLLLDNMDSLKANRRFELRAELTYMNNAQEKIVEQYCSFDWMNTDWQYCAFPVTISEDSQDELKSIKVFFDYTNNTGDAKFYGMSLKRGEWEYSEFKDNLKTYTESSSSEYITYFDYDDNKKLIKTTTQKKNDEKQFVTTFAYNQNGSLVRSIDYNGIITENVYNDKGSKIKSITYHKDEPANKFITTEEVDDKGQQTTDYNEFGEKISENTFVDKTSLVESSTDTNGNKISYGYDVYDDNLLQITTTVDDKVNSNITHYTANLLTSLTHNNIEIKFEYDGFGKQTKVDIAGNEYCRTEYEDIVETQILENGSSINVVTGQKTTTINAKNEKFIVYTDLDGNVTKIEFVNASGILSTITENRYDGYGNLLHTKDNEMQNETGYLYDEFGRIIEKTYTQNNTPVSIKNSYDKYGNVSTTTVTIGSVVDSYENTYDYSNPQPKHISTKIGNVTETYGYDKLGRIKETQLGSLYSKHFNYLQKGNYTSNLVASEWFGKNGIVKDSIKYSYDQNGNIIKVFENGELIQSFEYDGISRLIRENNKKLNKTTTFEYDAGGNIVRKIEYGYTTIATNNLSGGTVIPYTYPTSGWKDQLLSYNFETIEYDALGNPITYRNNDLSWSHGRQLDRFNDITYKYNADGIRTSKTVNGVTTQYFLDGTKILAQSNGNMLIFHYGSEGVIGFTYQGIGEYYYKKNIFGDIIGIIDANGTEIVKYVYDAWGNHKIEYLDNSEQKSKFVAIDSNLWYNASDSNNKTIAIINPFRYRSYYYDVETGLYYLNSRYYDPETGRFINADDISTIDVTQIALNGLNLYAYCLNNPVNEVDEDGNIPKWLKWLFVGIGAIFVIAAAAILITATAGTALTGLAGAIAIGAAKGALIGATVGTIAGGVIGGAVSGWTVEGFLTGMALGFGIGAVIGAVIGGISGYMSYIPSKITGFTRHGLNQVISRNGHGVSNKAILDTINNSTSIIRQGFFRQSFKFVGKDSVVILNKYGKLITSWARRSIGWRF